MVKVEGHRIVRAPVQKVFQLISRLDAQPRVTGLWLTATSPGCSVAHKRGPRQRRQQSDPLLSRNSPRWTRRAQRLRQFRRHSGNSNRLEHLRPKEEDRDDAGAVVDAGVAAGETGRGPLRGPGTGDQGPDRGLGSRDWGLRTVI